MSSEGTDSSKSKSLWNGIKKRGQGLKRKASTNNVSSIKKEESEEEEEQIILSVGNKTPKNASMPFIGGRPRSVSSFSIQEAQDIIHEPEQKIVPKARKKPQFGIHPTNLMTRFPDEPVPAIVVACTEVLEKDLMKEGIFRIPGRMTDILEMKISFEQGKGLGVQDPDTYTIAGLLAQFFRDLPEPLLTFELYQKWVAIPSTNSDKILSKLKRLTKKLPPANYNLLKYFIMFLTKVAKHGGANRMSSKNLALVFGASLLNPPDDVPYDLNSIKAQCDVIEQLIGNYKFVFEDGKAEETVSKRVDKQVATIPAGKIKPAGGSASGSLTSRKKKPSFFDRPQFSNSSRLSSSLESLHTKPILPTSVSMSTASVTHSTSKKRKVDRRKKRKTKTSVGDSSECESKD